MSREKGKTDVEESFGLVGMDAPDGDPDIGPAILMIGYAAEEESTLEQLLEDFTQEADTIQILDQREITISGVPGLAADLRATDDADRAVAGRIIVALSTPTQQFTMVGIAPTERWDNEFAPLFEAVQDSISFFEPTLALDAEEELEPAAETEATDTGQEMWQWATSATASSQYGSPNWAASQATGAPDTPECGDHPTAWASLGSNTVEWIELYYETPVYPTEISVIQSNSPNQVVKVELIDTGGAYYEVYTGDPEDLWDVCPYTLAIPVTADYAVAGVKLTIDQSVIGAPWNEIDAVELAGYVADATAKVPSTATEETEVEAETPTAMDTEGSEAETTETADPPPTAEPASEITETAPETAGVASACGTWVAYNQGHGLPADIISAIAVTSDGTAWIGTANGAASIDGQAWTTVTADDGLSANVVNAIAEAPDGALWFGTKGGVSRYDGTTWTNYTVDDGIVDDHIDAVAVEDDGGLWVGTWEGVSYFDGSAWTTYTEANGLAYKKVNDIVVAPDGTLWFGTGGQGASQYDGTTWTTYRADDGLVSYYVEAIAVGSDGSLWFGTGGNGVSHYDGQSWSTFTEAEGLVSPWADVIAVAPDGSPWVGTRDKGVGHCAPAE